MNKTVRCKKTCRPLNASLTKDRSTGAGKRIRAKLIGFIALSSLMLNFPGSSFASVLPTGIASVLPTRPPCLTAVTGSDTVHSIQVSRSQTSKRHKIKLYPDAGQQVLFFSANGQDGKIYQLYLFDVFGKLISQTSIRNRETTVLTNISEGNYMFEVFSDDERIENGRLTVK
jgi:hypothetical protein